MQVFLMLHFPCFPPQGFFIFLFHCLLNSEVCLLYFLTYTRDLEQEQCCPVRLFSQISLGTGDRSCAGRLLPCQVLLSLPGYQATCKHPPSLITHKHSWLCGQLGRGRWWGAAELESQALTWCLAS